MAEEEHFEKHRPLLFSIAYRMLGSVADAEDVVQEVYLRWRQVPEAEVRSSRAYLSTVVTRLSIDRLRSARAKREEYVGPWLPEPLVAESDAEGATPSGAVELEESLSMAFLVLLESLSPTERAVFLLREVFGYGYGEIARIVGKGETNTRQIAYRARSAVEARRPRFDPSPEQGRRLTERFLAAARDGDLEGLLELLADEVTVWSDGGGPDDRRAESDTRQGEGSQVLCGAGGQDRARARCADRPCQRGPGGRRLRGRISRDGSLARRRRRAHPGGTGSAQPGQARSRAPASLAGIARPMNDEKDGQGGSAMEEAQEVLVTGGNGNARPEGGRSPARKRP